MSVEDDNEAVKVLLERVVDLQRKFEVERERLDEALYQIGVSTGAVLDREWLDKLLAAHGERMKYGTAEEWVAYEFNPLGDL